MVECSFEPRSQIAGKYDVEDAVFLNKFAWKYLSKCGYTHRIELNMEKSVRDR